MLGSVPTKDTYWVCHGSVSVSILAVPPVQLASPTLALLI
jgi:hypothetical protein